MTVQQCIDSLQALASLPFYGGGTRTSALALINAEITKLRTMDPTASAPKESIAWTTDIYKRVLKEDPIFLSGNPTERDLIKDGGKFSAFDLNGTEKIRDRRAGLTAIDGTLSSTVDKKHGAFFLQAQIDLIDALKEEYKKNSLFEAPYTRIVMTGFAASLPSGRRKNIWTAITSRLNAQNAATADKINTTEDYSADEVPKFVEQEKATLMETSIYMALIPDRDADMERMLEAGGELETFGAQAKEKAKSVRNVIDCTRASLERDGGYDRLNGGLYTTRLGAKIASKIKPTEPACVAAARAAAGTMFSGPATALSNHFPRAPGFEVSQTKSLLSNLTLLNYYKERQGVNGLSKKEEKENQQAIEYLSYTVSGQMKDMRQNGSGVILDQVQAMLPTLTQEADKAIVDPKMKDHEFDPNGKVFTDAAPEPKRKWKEKIKSKKHCKYPIQNLGTGETVEAYRKYFEQLNAKMAEQDARLKALEEAQGRAQGGNTQTNNNNQSVVVNAGGKGGKGGKGGSKPPKDPKEEKAKALLLSLYKMNDILAQALNRGDANVDMLQQAESMKISRVMAELQKLVLTPDQATNAANAAHTAYCSGRTKMTEKDTITLSDTATGKDVAYAFDPETGKKTQTTDVAKIVYTPGEEMAIPPADKAGTVGLATINMGNTIHVARADTDEVAEVIDPDGTPNPTQHLKQHNGVYKCPKPTNQEQMDRRYSASYTPTGEPVMGA